MDRLRLPRPSVPLWVRLGVPISLIIALAIGLITFLNYYNYEKTYKQLNVSRITVVARDLRQAIETGLNVGLAPRNNTQLGKDLEIARDHTEGLRFAVVIDENGNRLVEVGETTTEQDWSKRLASVANESQWLGEGARTYQIGMPYRNSFGVRVGAVVLGYDKGSIDRAASAMWRTLLGDWLKAVAVLSCLAFAGIWWITRRLEHDLTKAGAAIGTALSQEPTPALTLPVLGEEIERGIPGFVAQSRAAAAALAASRAAAE
jgi:sensor histidine kinase regulating citrate/malate metabolism